MANGNGIPRADQVELIDDPVKRDRWLAGEVDGLEGHVRKIESRLSQIALIGIGILVSTTSTAITLLLAGVTS